MLTNQSHPHSKSPVPATALIKTAVTTKEASAHHWLQNGLQPNFIQPPLFRPQAINASVIPKPGYVNDSVAVGSQHQVMNPLSFSTGSMLPSNLSSAFGTTPLNFGDLLSHRPSEPREFHSTGSFKPPKHPVRNPHSLVYDARIVDAVQQRLAQVRQHSLLMNTLHPPLTNVTASRPLHSRDPPLRSSSFSLHSLVSQAINSSPAKNTAPPISTQRNTSFTLHSHSVQSVGVIARSDSSKDLHNSPHSHKCGSRSSPASSRMDDSCVPTSTVVCVSLRASPLRSVIQPMDPIHISSCATPSSPPPAATQNVPICSTTVERLLPSASRDSQDLSPLYPLQQNASEASTINSSNVSLPCMNMRHANVLRYPKYTNRKNSGFDRRLKHTGLIVDPHLTLRLLRKFLQPFINQAVDKVLQHYMEEYIMIAVRNIRENLGDEAVTEEDLMKFRRSVMQRVAMQYFPKEEHNSSSVENSTIESPQEISHSNFSHCDSKKTCLHLPRNSPKSKHRYRPTSESLAFHPLLNNGNPRNGDSTSNLEMDESTSCTVSPRLSPSSDDRFSVTNRPSSNFSDSSLFHHSLPGVRPLHVDCDNSILKVPSVILAPLNSHELRGTASQYASPRSCHSSTSSTSTVGFFHHPPSPDGCATTTKTAALNTTEAPSEIDPECKQTRQHFASQVYSFDSSTMDEHTQDTSADEVRKFHQEIKLRRSSSLKDRLKRTRKRSLAWYNWGGCTRRPKVRRTKDSIPNQPSSLRRGNNAGQKSTELTAPKVNASQTSSSKLSKRNCDISRSSSPNPHSSLPLVMDQNTKFTLGSSANTWLGLGAARGRIYTKYPELFRYLCDAEDKTWLVNSGLLTSQGVKAFLMHSDQVRQIRQQYKVASEADDSAADEDQLKTFTVPLWLFRKIQLTVVESPHSSQSKCSSTNLPSRSGSTEPNSSDADVRRFHSSSSNFRTQGYSSSNDGSTRQSSTPQSLKSSGRQGERLSISNSMNSQICGQSGATPRDISRFDRSTTLCETPQVQLLSRQPAFANSANVFSSSATISNSSVVLHSTNNPHRTPSAVPTSSRTTSPTSPTPPTLKRFDSI